MSLVLDLYHGEFSILAIILSVVACSVVYGWGLCSSSDLPPGPRGLPIIGNVHQLPKEHQEIVFFEWGQKFGDVVYARLFRTPVIIINSYQVARDLMEKQSGNYSDRPTFTLINELMDMGSILPFMPYGSRFRKVRKWFHAAFQPEVALGYRPFQTRETHVVLNGLLKNPDAYEAYFARFGAAVLMEVTYGHQVTTDDDLYVRVAHDAMSGISVASGGGGVLVDFFPILQYYPTWMPGSGFKKHALRVREYGRIMFDAPYDMVKSRMEISGGRPSFTSDLLENHMRSGKLSEDDERDIKGAAATFYAAGAETFTSVMATFILAMVRHPEIFHRAREEIDKMVGLGRLPDFGDRDALPYLNCIIKEVYRWNVPGPLAIPHAATQDGVYRGYRIPAGSTIIANIWAMSRNEFSPDPDNFLPERFADMSKEDPIDPKNMIFGFGRRTCPGKDFADSCVYLLTSNIITTMDISKARDAKGQEITPPLEFTSGIVSAPKPFKCVIKPRSKQAIDLIQGFE